MNVFRELEESEFADQRIELRSQHYTILRRPRGDHSCEVPILYVYTGEGMFHYQCTKRRPTRSARWMFCSCSY